ncbi:MAG: AMP-binding protein [Candidatus Brocadiia bacterium]
MSRTNSRGNYSPVLRDYLLAFEDPDEPFLICHRFTPERTIETRELSRGDLWSLARRAASVLRERNVVSGKHFTHYFTSNRPEDLAFRLGAVMVGAIPVTVNWQADTPERIFYKMELTGSRLVVVDSGTPGDVLETLEARVPGLEVFNGHNLAEYEDLSEEKMTEGWELGPESTRIVIFTSGTSGQPKGVELPYRSYRVNRRTFESFLGFASDERLVVLVVNPLHHTNSTAITDWALRRRGARLHLVERYSTLYWGLLPEIVCEEGRVVAPLVARHFDYLENRCAEGKLPVGKEKLKEAMSQIEFLLGSAPVGPTTVERVRSWTGRLPLVRFGSTETCLQVMGTSPELAEEQRLKAFQRGWSHRWDGEEQPGYYIGRPHPPHTETLVVRSLDRRAEDYFEHCEAGEPGYLVARGDNVMKNYVGDPEATRAVFHEDGWYGGFGDVCFWLGSPDGSKDYYWLSRESTILIRGGANYAYACIEGELREFGCSHYELEDGDFDLAVVGLRVESEHEDSCCVTLELLSERAQDKQDIIGETFLQEARQAVTKPARPEYFRFAAIPRNFKGAVRVPKLKQEFQKDIKGRDHDQAEDERV